MKQLSKRGISVIISSLLLIAIAVAAGVLLYAYSTSLLGNIETPTPTGIKDQLILEAYQWPQSSTLVLTLRNVGSTPINLVTADWFVGGVQVSAATLSGLTGGSTAMNLQPQGSCTATLTILSPMMNGESYPVRIVTANGASFSYSVVQGQSG